MLKIFKSMGQLRFSELLDVYAESNALNGLEQYPNLSRTLQMLEAEQNFYQYLKDIFFRQADSFYAVWENEGRYVAALRIEPYEDGFLLCGLETAPDARRQGYASVLILAVQKHLSQERKCKIYSHISKKNGPSLEVHKRCGFKIILNHALYSDGSVLHNHYTLLFDKKSET